MSNYHIDMLRESMVKILGSDGQTASGSGFIIRSDGYLVTCHHVIYQLVTLKVEYQRQVYEAQWCKEFSDPEVDIAVLKIDVTDAKAVTIVNPQHPLKSVTVYGFPLSQKKIFPEGIDVFAENLRPSAPVNTINTYRSREITANNPWNKLPQEFSTFRSYRIDAKVEVGTSGGAVFAEELGGVVGVIQCSKSDESYVIRWDNITLTLEQLGLLETTKTKIYQSLTLWEDAPPPLNNLSKVDWDTYLESICHKYVRGRDTYTLTDVEGCQRYAEPISLLFDSTLMVEIETVLPAKETRDKTQQKTERFDILTGLRKYAENHVLLVGQPGSGKSTALVQLLLEEAEKGRGTEKKRVKIPVLVQLRYYQTSVLELIRSFLKKHGLLLEIAEIETLLFEKRLLLLVDGVNELPSEEARRELIAFRFRGRQRS